MFRPFIGLSVAAIALTFCQTSQAETVEAFGGDIKLETPKEWKTVQPKSRIIEKEYAVKKEGVEGAARLTMMAAGGDIEANISRWIGQFKDPNGGSVKDKAKIEKMAAGKNEVHVVQLEGNYKESMGGGPFAPGKTVMREDYQMLGAIIVNNGRKYFVKMIGPKAIVSANQEAFKKMLKTVK